MEKYYIPNINELYPDFEYEVKDGDKWIKVNDFTNAYEYEDSCFYGFYKDLQAGNIRVKYLDRDDMIELGWHDKIQADKYYLVVDGDEIQFYPDAYQREEGQGIGCSIYYTLGDKINQMAVWIKNKSELRQLMKFMGWLK